MDVLVEQVSQWRKFMQGFPWVNRDIGESKKTYINLCNVKEVIHVGATQTADHASEAEIAEEEKLGKVVHPLREDG